MQVNSACTDPDFLSEVWINSGTAVDLNNHVRWVMTNKNTESIDFEIEKFLVMQMGDKL